MEDYTDKSNGTEHRNSQVRHIGTQCNGPTLIQQTSSVLISQLTYEFKVFNINLIADATSV